MTKKDEKPTEILIFAGVRLIDNEKLAQCWIDEDGTERFWNNLVRSCAVGQRFRVRYTDDTKESVYTKGQYEPEYLDRLDIEDDAVVRWQAEHTANTGAFNARKRRKDEAKANALVEQLAPIRDLYKRSPADVKRGLMAEVIRVITT